MVEAVLPSHSAVLRQAEYQVDPPVTLNLVQGDGDGDGPDSDDNAAIEIAYFFKPEEIVG